MEDIYPYIAYGGIKIHDWDKWEDPFRLTMDAYWKYQAEGAQALCGARRLRPEQRPHLNVTDARYLNTVKLFIGGISPLEYVAHRGLPTPAASSRPRPARRLPDAVARRDPSRPDPESTVSNYSKFYSGCTIPSIMPDRVWFLSVPKSFFDDAITAGPFEFMVSIGFSLQYVLTNLLFVPFVSGAATAATWAP